MSLGDAEVVPLAPSATDDPRFSPRRPTPRTATGTHPSSALLVRPSSPTHPATEEYELQSCCSSPGHCTHPEGGEGTPPLDLRTCALIAAAPNCQKSVPPITQSVKKGRLPRWCKIDKLQSAKDDGYCSSTSSPQFSGDLARSNGRVDALEVDSLAVGCPAGEEKDDPVKETMVLSGLPLPPPDDDRETWDQKADFLLSIIGFAVDLANVWRFPFLCYRNGGGAFLIPYGLMLLFGAMPLFYMELVLGQYNRQGPVSVWKICPIFKGVGLCSVLVAFYTSFYYNVIIAWSFYFLFASFTSELPWTRCNNTWNSDNCWDGFNKSTHPSVLLANNLSQLQNPLNIFSGNDSTEVLVVRPTTVSAAFEYFERAVLELHLSDGMHDLGFPKWQLVLCLLLVYGILYLALFKGVKSSGKVVWVTATMPYVVLTILLIRGALLPGAREGLIYFLNPDLSRLSQSQVWVDAAVQIFYSVGAGFGVHLSYASYNTFNNNCYRDCMITTMINSFTSFFSGLVIFTYLGYMAQRQDVHISKVATEGPGLVFQVYPEAIATLPGSQFWAVLFFFMLVTLGMDSSMGGLECVITGLLDEFRNFFGKRRHAREIFTACVIFASFSVALVNVTRGGGYVFQWFDTYSAGISLLCSALFEAIAVSWFYGLDRFTEDIYEMLGFRPGFYWRLCWKFLSPGFLVTVIVFAIIFKQPLTYNTYVYPFWAEILGWVFGLTSVAMIPIWAIFYLCRSQKGTLKERFAIGISPEKEHEAIRHCGTVKRFSIKHWVEV